MQATYRDTVFNPAEAAGYTVDTDADEEVEARLKPDSLPRILNLLRTVVGAVRAIQLYPAESRAAVDARRHALGAIEAILADNQRLHLARVDQALLVNGQRLDVSEYGELARSFRRTLEQGEIKGVSFETGLTETELGAFLEALSHAKPETIDHGFWSRFSEERSLDHLRLEQMRYASVRRRVGTTPGETPTRAEERLEEPELAEIPKVLRAFTGAVVNLKLYPVGSTQVAESMRELRDTLQPILRTHPACSLALVNRTLLANGVRVPTESYDNIANRFIGLLEPLELRSITFDATVTTDELVALVEALRDPPAEINVKYWQEFAREQGFTGLSLNEQRYKPGVVETVETLVGGPDANGQVVATESLEERVQALADHPSEDRAPAVWQGAVGARRSGPVWPHAGQDLRRLLSAGSRGAGTNRTGVRHDARQPDFGAPASFPQSVRRFPVASPGSRRQRAGVGGVDRSVAHHVRQRGAVRGLRSREPGLHGAR
jgi:hypothetical protein